MHKSGECPFLKAREVQRREFLATGEPILVNRALITGEKMTGDGIQQHHAVTAFLYVPVVEIFAAELKMAGQRIGLGLIDVYHQAFAAIAAGSTIYRRRNQVVEFRYQRIDLLLIMAFEEGPEPVILRLLFAGMVRYKTEVCMDIDRFQASKVAGIYRFSR